MLGRLAKGEGGRMMVDTDEVAVAEVCGESDACTAARRRDKAATKQALLDAAVAVFARHGYDAATTREVAAAAGINEALIQRYFGGKAGLLLTIADDFCGGRAAACTLAPMSPDLETEIAGFLRYEIQHAADSRDFMRVLVARAMVDSDLAAVLRDRMLESRVPLLLARLERLRAAGRIAPDADLHDLATTVVTLGFALGFTQQLVFRDPPEALSAHATRIARTIARGAVRPAD